MTSPKRHRFRTIAKASTAASGYSGRHVKVRAALIARHRVGDPCCIGGEPLGPAGRELHLDHCPLCKGQGCNAPGCGACGFPGYRGLACARHNRQDGARRGRTRLKTSRLRW